MKSFILLILILIAPNVYSEHSNSKRQNIDKNDYNYISDKYYKKPSEFTFQGTYTLKMDGETRVLTVCDDDYDNGYNGIYWAIAYQYGDNPYKNYIYAIGRDYDGIDVVYYRPTKSSSSYKGNSKTNVYDRYFYEAKSAVFWFNDDTLGVTQATYSLRYNPNKKYSHYTLSTNDQNVVYELNKVSHDAKGECFKPGEIPFYEIEYPAVFLSEDLKTADLGCQFKGAYKGKCYDIQKWQDYEGPACWGYYNENKEKFFKGGETGNNVKYYWENRLKISTGSDRSDDPICHNRYSTQMVIAESYNSYFQVVKCEGSTFGYQYRFFRDDDKYGQCGLFKRDSKYFQQITKNKYAKSKYESYLNGDYNFN